MSKWKDKQKNKRRIWLGQCADLMRAVERTGVDKSIELDDIKMFSFSGEEADYPLSKQAALAALLALHPQNKIFLYGPFLKPEQIALLTDQTRMRVSRGQISQCQLDSVMMDCIIGRAMFASEFEDLTCGLGSRQNVSAHK